MQKLAPLMVGVLAAWLSIAHAAEPDYIIQSNAAPLNPLVPQLQVAPVTASVPVPAPPSVPIPVSDNRLRIALVLPTESKTLGEAAQVVRAGFEAASKVDGDAKVVYVDEQESNVIERYRAAVASGVKVVVGPLTRQGISAIAPYVTVPTLALNALEPGLVLNPKLLSLSLTVEGEARQMARLMHEDGSTSPLVVSASDVLSRRLTLAFVDEWKKATGAAPRVVDWPLSAPVSEVLAASDAVFVAMEPTDAAALKPALPETTVVYATSQLNTRTPNPALAGIRFIDMPWFLMTAQDAVRRYPRPTSAMTLQTERLYALGIDAYRLALQMAAGKISPSSLKLHGVTGDLRLGRDRQFERILPLAVMMPDAAP